MLLLGLWIPQQSLVSQEIYSQWKFNHPKLLGTLEWLGFTEIYVSPAMLTLWAFFFLNLALVMWQRLPLIKKRIAIPEVRPENPETAPGYPFHASYPLPT